MHEHRFQDHFLRPRGQGSLDQATHTATVLDGACGDELSLDLEVCDGSIAAVRFRVRGCSGAIAAGSALATLLPGRDARTDALAKEEIDAELGTVPPAKRHALRLAMNAFREAVQSNSIT